LTGQCLTQNGTQFAPVTLQTCDPGNPGSYGRKLVTG
jgi:hypothetical protein